MYHLPKNNAIRTNIPFTRVLNDDSPQFPYRRRTNEEKFCLHWGQRKLLLSEIEFLTLHGEESKNVVYAGAAPGNHIEFLSELFPNHYFYCVDPAPFSKHLINSNIFTYQNKFDNYMACQFKQLNPLFISDIRTANYTTQSAEDVEKAIKQDMDAQMRWHIILRAPHAMLKFRLPWSEATRTSSSGITTYLDGELRLPVWGPQSTTECRLIVDRHARTRDYDNTTYEEQMFYFNTVQRIASYDNERSVEFSHTEGLDACYDCTSEITILQKYLDKHHNVSNAPDVGKLSYDISRRIATNRTLLDPTPHPEDRLATIMATTTATHSARQQ